MHARKQTSGEEDYGTKRRRERERDRQREREKKTPTRTCVCVCVCVCVCINVRDGAKRRTEREGGGEKVRDISGGDLSIEGWWGIRGNQEDHPERETA